MKKRYVNLSHNTEKKGGEFMFFIPKGTVVKNVDDIKNFILSKKALETGNYCINGSLRNEKTASNLISVEVTGIIGFSSINSKEWLVKFSPCKEGFKVDEVIRSH